MEKKKREGYEFERFVRQKLNDLVAPLNLKVHPNEYAYDYERLGISVGRNLPSCDIAILNDHELFLIEIDTKGDPTSNAAKVWVYIRGGGLFDELGRHANVHLIHFVSEKPSEYDFSIARELADGANEEASAKLKGLSISFWYEIERFDLGSKSIEDSADDLCQTILLKLKKGLQRNP